MTLLKNIEIKQWLSKNPYMSIEKSLRKTAEDSWGKGITGKNTCQWSTPLSESIFLEYLKNKNSKIITRNKIYKSSSGKTLKPDFETENAIYELKCRTWSTTGTAGEKILATPYKYSELPSLSGKPLYIVLMAYQEFDNFELFNTTQSIEKKGFIDFWRNSGITFVKFTDILEGHYPETFNYINSSSPYIQDLECL
jgi:hypothetical protein